MGDVVGRCVSSELSIEILEESKAFIPKENLARYVAALNRAKYILSRQKPEKPVNGFCGACRCYVQLTGKENFCPNCGKAIDWS